MLVGSNGVDLFLADCLFLPTILTTNNIGDFLPQGNFPHKTHFSVLFAIEFVKASEVRQLRELNR